jgi:hypothetical protein
MRSDQFVPLLHIGRREDRANVVKRHIEIAKTPDDLRDPNLICGVATITVSRIDLRGLKESRLMIAAQCFTVR